MRAFCSASALALDHHVELHHKGLVVLFVKQTVKILNDMNTMHGFLKSSEAEHTQWYYGLDRS